MNKKIPILLLVGFLGSGKTSLLNHILKDNQGLKIGVIINDFGSINIDSLLVTRQTDSKLELSNGCICCSSDEGGLDDAISQLAHAGSSLDYIVIEASGLAEPRELSFMLQHQPNKYARLDTVAAVVDAENVLDTKQEHPEFFAQLEAANLIIINKIDLVSKATLKKVTNYIAFLNSQARTILAEHSIVDTRLLLDIDAHGCSVQKSGDQVALTDKVEHSHTHTHDNYQKIEFTSRKPLDPEAFEKLIKSSQTTGLYRAKGFVYFGMKGLEQKFVLQLVGNRSELKYSDWQGAIPETKLVFIGTNLNDLESSLKKCIDKEPDNIAGNLLTLSDYV